MNKDEKAAKLEKKLLQTQFPVECENLPYDEVTKEEQKVVTKCIKHEDINDKEFTLLKKTLQKYREYITKHKPNETVEAYQKTKDMIKTEADWLALVDNKTNRTLRVNVPFNGNYYPMEFEILPLDDSSVVPSLQQHVDLFKEYSRDEVKAFSRAQQGQVISPEERKIVEKIQKEIEAKSNEERIKTMNQFLATQLRLPESTSDIPTRIEFWEKFPFITKAAIMAKVEDRLGLTDQDNEKLFPTGQ